MKKEDRERLKSKAKLAEAERQMAAATKNGMVRGPLPDGAQFKVTWNAAAKVWQGSLTVDGRHFTAKKRAVFSLLTALDAMYRRAKLIDDEDPGFVPPKETVDVSEVVG